LASLAQIGAHALRRFIARQLVLKLAKTSSKSSCSQPGISSSRIGT